jgi:hypothetical protein
VNKLKHRSLCIITITFIFLLCQCTKEEPAAQDLKTQPAVKDGQKPKDQINAPVSPQGKMNAGKDNVIMLAPSPDAQKKTPQPRVVTSETGLFAYFPQQRLMAEDFKIGPLQDNIATPEDFKKAHDCVTKFLESVMKKEPDYSLVAANARDQLKAAISYPLQQGYVPQDFRIGKMAFEGENEIRANIRLFRGDAITEGEIYIMKTDEAWYVNDLQVGFTLLAQKYEKPKEPFMPGSYQFLLEE